MLSIKVTKEQVKKAIINAIGELTTDELIETYGHCGSIIAEYEYIDSIEKVEIKFAPNFTREDIEYDFPNVEITEVS